MRKIVNVKNLKYTAVAVVFLGVFSMGFILNDKPATEGKPMNGDDSSNLSKDSEFS